MTMVYCRTCGRDVHITHDESECVGEPDKKTPPGLRGEPEPEPETEER